MAIARHASVSVIERFEHRFGIPEMTTIRNRSGTRVVLCWSVVLLISMVACGALIALGPRMAAVRPGSTEVFWKIACGVSLHPDVDDIGDAYYVDDDWVAYDVSLIHGSEIYYLPTADASAQFDAVIKELGRAHDQGEDTDFVKGYVKWRDDNERPHNIKTLLECIKKARQESYIAEDIDLLAYSISAEQDFWQRWQRADWYWANFVFEWTLLSGLALFAMWPGIRGGSPFRWALHFGLLPLLFLLPAYLGYGWFTFTSTGPSGGIVYPFLLLFARHGSVTSLDSWVLAHLPQILEPLSTPIGSPMALTGMGMCGPTSAIKAGVAIGGLVFAIALGYQHWIRRRHTTGAGLEGC